MSSVTLEKYLFAEKGSTEGLSKTILESLIKVHAKTVALCPVDKGQLKNSYMITLDSKEQLFNSLPGDKAPADQKISLRSDKTIGYVGTNSDHWYPEFGTRYQVAQPHLRPAGEIVKGSSFKSVASKYCKEEMIKEFKRKRIERTSKVVK